MRFKMKRYKLILSKYRKLKFIKPFADPIFARETKLKLRHYELSDLSR